MADLRSWAKEDPSLHWLREQGRFAFLEALGEDPLSEIPLLDHDLRRELVNKGVVDVATLRKCRAAGKLHVKLPVAFVAGLQLADLAGIGDEHLPVVIAAALTADALRFAPAAQTTKRLGAVARRKGFAVPSADDVEGWKAVLLAQPSV